MDPFSGSWYYVDVSCTGDVSKVISMSIFKVKWLCRDLCHILNSTGPQICGNSCVWCASGGWINKQNLKRPISFWVGG